MVRLFRLLCLGTISDEVLNESREAFIKYDLNETGSIELHEVRALLEALDLLKYVPSSAQACSFILRPCPLEALLQICAQGGGWPGAVTTNSDALFHADYFPP